MTEKTDWTGRRFETEVGPVAHGGHCVARVAGRVVFVRHALPGERVVVLVTEDRGGSYCRADAVEVLTASPDRVAPPCPFAAPELGTRRCGGCDWQHAAWPAQRELKAAVVAEQLHRLAGVDRPVEVEPLPGGPLGWRTRTRLAVDRAGRPGLRVHRSHQVLAVDHCPITVPGALDEVLERRWTPGGEVEVTRDANGHNHVSELRPERGGRPGGGSRAGGRTAARATPHRVSGGDVAEERAAGRTWRVAAHGFWQVHPAAADVLARTVGQWAEAPAGGCAWDLYGGVGLFAAVLADQVGRDGAVLLVESSRRAVADAERNLADLPQVRAHADRVERALASAELTGPGSAWASPDVVVLDPPRKGAGHAVVDAVAGRAPARVVYVACDPAALARDVARFGEHGYRLTELRAFDAFPMTHHVECVALLTR